jgi:hypothetical protein
VAAAEQGAARESQASVTGDARAWIVGACASSARTTEERVGPGGSSRTKSDLAVGYDEGLGGASSGLGLPGERDRLLHAGDRCLAEGRSLRRSESLRVCGARID